MFVPFIKGAGGSIPPPVLIGLGVIMYSIVLSTTVPFFRTNAEQIESTVKIQHKTINSPDITAIDVENVECLRKKGYIINSVKDWETPSHMKYSKPQTYWTTIANIQKPEGNVSLDKVIADCKECEVYTDVKYQIKLPIAGTIKGERKLYWHKCQLL